MVNYGWVCPKCGRVYAPNQEMCLYCGGGSVPKQYDKTQPHIPDQGYTWATNTIDNYISTLGGVVSCSPAISTLETKQTNDAVCNAYCDKYCLATKEPFITSCEGKKEKCESE